MPVHVRNRVPGAGRGVQLYVRGDRRGAPPYYPYPTYSGVVTASRGLQGARRLATGSYSCIQDYGGEGVKSYSYELTVSSK